MTTPLSAGAPPSALAALARLVQRGGPACLTLTGQSGVGKSFLARSLVTSLRRADVDVLLVDDVDDDAGRAQVVAAQEQADVVVATSVLPLGVVAAERTWPVLPVREPGRTVRGVDAGAGLDLVAGLLATDVDHLTTRDRAVLDWVCEEVGGLPLGLELAAEMGRSLGVDWLARTAAAGDLVDALARPTVTPATRHPSLRAAVDRTAAALDPAARELLAELAVLTAGFTTGTAEQVGERLGVPHPSRSLATLVDLALVARLPGSSRLTVSAPLQARTRRHGLPVVGDRPARTVLLGLARDAVRAMDAPGDTEVLAGLRDEADNLRDVLRPTMARVTRDPDPRWLVEGVDLLAALSVVAVSDAADDELDGYAATLRDRFDDLPPAGRALLVHASTELTAARREAPPDRGREELVADAHRGIDAARAAGDPQLLLRLLALPIRRLLHVQDPALALACAAEGHALAAAVGSQPWLARFEAWSAMGAFARGADEAAEELGLRALARARRTGDDGALLSSAIALRWPWRSRTHLPPTLPDLPALVDLARRRGDHQSAYVLQTSTAWALYAEGAHEEAVRACREWVALQYSQGAPPMGYGLSWVLGLVADGRGEHERSAHLLTDVGPRCPRTRRTSSPSTGSGSSRRVAVRVTCSGRSGGSR